MSSFLSIVENAEKRAAEARKIADQLKGDDRLHRLAMQTVFVLEDVFFALREMAERDGDMSGPGPKP